MGLRTPFAKAGTALARVPPHELGRIAARARLKPARASLVAPVAAAVGNDGAAAGRGGGLDGAALNRQREHRA